MYIIVGLGNPGTKYEKTRHNVGFQVVDAFLQKNLSGSFQFDTRLNAMTLEERWSQEQLLLVKPQTFMNNSGKTVQQLYRKYAIKDWVLVPRATTHFTGRHFRSVHGIFTNPLEGRFAKQPKSAWQTERTDRYMIVIHDDVDVMLGKIKISLGSNSGGHKGVESIIQQTGTKQFARIRVGVQPKDGKPANVEEVVVQKFTPEETPVITQSILNAEHALEIIIAQGIEKAMNEYN